VRTGGDGFIFDCVIIGAGPAGLFCALSVAGAGKRVVVLEKKQSCGKKLLITGTGQCNLTHGGDIREFFSHYGDHGKFLRPSLLGFTNRDLTGFFESHGLAMVTDENEKVFPATRKASDVLAVLLDECRKTGVEISCDEAVRSVEKTGSGFLIETENGRYQALNVVIATGGASYPSTGSTGDGYRLATVLGQPVTETRPALAAVYVMDYLFQDLAGISFGNVAVSLFRNNKKIRQLTGDLLLTHKGLSGPVILHLSRYIDAGDLLKVSFLPGTGRETLQKELIGMMAEHGTRQVKTALSGYGLPERFVKKLLDLAGISPDLTCAHVTKDRRNKLIDLLTTFPFIVDACGGFHEAMVTAGGVALDEVNPKTMESKLVPSLYFTGEVLDIDGDTGGYNLQAAFSTAFAAAKGIKTDKKDVEKVIFPS